MSNIPLNKHPYSYLSTIPKEYSGTEIITIKIDLGSYCRQRYITKMQSRILMRNGWIIVTKYRHKYYVKEVCTEQINAYLARPKCK